MKIIFIIFTLDTNPVKNSNSEGIPLKEILLLSSAGAVEKNC